MADDELRALAESVSRAQEAAESQGREDIREMAKNHVPAWRGVFKTLLESNRRSVMYSTNSSGEWRALREDPTPPNLENVGKIASGHVDGWQWYIEELTNLFGPPFYFEHISDKNGRSIWIYC